MQQAAYNTFYAASAGAGGALIGLLFVSVSLSPDSTVRAGAPWERRAAASSSFTALVNAFFVSLGALLPQTNAGIIVLAMSSGSLLTCLGLGVDLLKQRDGWRRTLRRGTLIALGLGAYAFEFSNGVQLTRDPADAAALQAVALVVLSIYGLGLLRAWELLGAQRYGVLSTVTGLRRRREPVDGSSADGADAAGRS